MNLEELRAAFRKGKKQKYVFFWKPEPPGLPGCLSQWQSAPFCLEGQRYVSAEHYMMAEKARLFGDEEALRNILRAGSPQAIKQLGRTVRYFDETTWKQHREAIVFSGNMGKFGQNERFCAFLLATGGKVLAEASPHDRVWGLGLTAEDASVRNPLLWKGENLLGFILMGVRDALRE